MKPKSWLSLQAAATHLNVHYTTLRRWADAGELPHMLTPGGHRRFNVSALDAFSLAHARGARNEQALPQAWHTRALAQTREDLPAQQQAHWLQTLDDDARAQHRAVGRKLMALTLQYLSAEQGDALLAEARAVGREYAVLTRAAGTPLTDALQATLFFRDRLLDASLDLPDSTRPRPADQARMLRRINALLNEVQLAIVAGYEVG